MRILIVYPAVDGLNNGNLVTAERWQKRLSELGHSVEVAASFDDASHDADQKIDLMIALHAVKSLPSIKKCSDSNPNCPIVVVLTGTDLYDANLRQTVQQSLTIADQIVVLQTVTAEDVPEQFREKVSVIYQSVDTVSWAIEKTDQFFEVCVVGHLRPVKVPLQASWAARKLPPESKIRVTQIGEALSTAIRTAAEKEERENSRYRWIGAVSRDDAMQRIAASDLLVNSSMVEGGAAVICEAVVAGTPILASRVAGNIGFLGEDYQGLFDVGDTDRLREMMWLAEKDRGFYQRLKDQCESRKHLFEPDFEKRKWAELIEKFES